MPFSKQTLAKIALQSLYVPGAEYVCWEKLVSRLRGWMLVPHSDGVGGGAAVRGLSPALTLAHTLPLSYSSRHPPSSESDCNIPAREPPSQLS